MRIQGLSNVRIRHGLAVALALLPATVAAQTVVTKLQETAGSPDDLFGRVIAFERGTLAAAEVGASAAGAVHIVDHAAGAPGATGWSAQALVVPADSAPEQHFGAALALSHDTLLVGAPGDDELGDDAGAAYAYARNRNGTPGNPADDTWVLLGKLHPQGPNPPAHFGSAVALAGDTAVIGADSSVDPAAFVFARDGHGTPGNPLDDSFVQLAQLLPEAPVTASSFGISVALTADQRTLLVGDSLDASALPQGKVSVFARGDNGTPANPLDDTWTRTHTFGAAPDPFGSNGFFGTQLALDPGGARLMVTERFAGSSFGGRVLAFDHAVLDPGDPFDDTWTQVTALEVASSYIQGFGDTVALRGDRALIWHSSFGFFPGTGYVVFAYERVGADWVIATELRAPDEAVGDGYGIGLAFLDDDTALIGASGGPYVDDYQAREGAVYVLDLPTSNPWTLPGGVGEPGLAGWGSLQPHEPATVRMYNSFHTGAPALLVLGLTAINAPFQGSILVPFPQLVIPLTLSDIGDAELTAPWPAAGVVPPGTTFIFQGWIPPAVPGFGWQATPAVTATQP